MLDWTLQWLNHAWTPWAAAGLLLLWGSGHWFALQGHFFRPLYRQLVDMRRQLEETPEEPILFAARYAEISEALVRHRLLAPAWSAFSKTLVVPPTRGVPLYGSRTPGHFFSADLLMGREAAHYYYRTVPNLLVGVGVLVTLVGLVAAIHFTIQGMASGDLYTTQSALMGLLNAASIKFLSSIAGLAIALLFSWEEKRHKYRLEREAELICQLWLERVVWTGDDSIGREQLQATQTQSRQLQEIADRLHQVITQPSFQAQTGKPPAESFLNEGVVERVAGQLEQAMETLGERMATVGTPMEMAPLVAALREEGMRMQTAHLEVMATLKTELSHRVAPADPFPSVERSARSDDLPLLMEQMGSQIERAILALGEKMEVSATQSSADAVLQAVRHEGARWMRANEETMQTLLEGIGHRLTAATATTTLSELAPSEREGLLERVAVRMEQAVASLGEVGLAPFFANLRREMEQMPDVGQKTLNDTVQSHFAQIVQQLDRVTAALESKVWAVDTLPDLTVLADAIRSEGERLLQANADTLNRLLTEQISSRSTGSARMDDPNASAVLTRIVDQLAAVSQALTAKAALADESVVASAWIPDLESLFDRIQQEGERVHDGHQRLLDRLESLSSPAHAALLAAATPVPTGEVVAVLNEQSLQPLLDGWRQEGERLVMAGEAAFERLLEEVVERLAPLSSAAALVGSGSTEPSEEPLGDGESEGPEGMEPLANQTALQPVLVEMTRILSRQRHEERRLLKEVVKEVNRAVTTLDARIGRATPLNMKMLADTVREQGDRLFARIATLAPTVTEMAQLMARQRGEEMRLMERVATEVNRSVAALDARIGRATPLQLQTLVHTVHEQGDRLWAGSQEIVQALRSQAVAGSVQPATPPAPVCHPETGEGVPNGHRVEETCPSLSPAPAPLPPVATAWAETVSLNDSLLVAYQSVSDSDSSVKTAPRAVLPLPRERSAESGPFARLLPAMTQRAREMREGRRALVVMAGRGGASLPGVSMGDQAVPLLAPTLLQAFRSQNGRSWQPLTAFIAQQTADFLDSQKRFSLFKS